MKTHTILYVKDQKQAYEFYKTVLKTEAILNVPGMSEFQLSQEHILGLMPEIGIKRLLGKTLIDPSKGSGIPRAELYFYVDNPNEYFDRAIKSGAKELSKLELRNWGDHAAYVQDLDGHVLAFAIRK